MARDILTAARLAAMPRHDGRPVPAVVPWGSCRTVPTPDPAWGWLDNCECVTGRCTPRFGELCPARQRQVMFGRACQVCGQPAAAGETIWFLTTAKIARCKEAGFHAGCGRFAFSVCPGLIGYRRDPGTEILIAGCASYQTAVSLRGGGALLPQDEARETATQDHGVQWAWAVLDNPVIYPIGDWLTREDQANA